VEEKIRLLEEEINKLRQDKEDREAALPRHSIRPHQMIAIEELEEEINRKEALLRSLKDSREETNR